MFVEPRKLNREATGFEVRACVSERLEDELSGGDLADELRALLPWLAHTELEQRFDRQTTVLRLATASLSAASRSGIRAKCNE